jgi:O-antigen/teichoic acid export membrane protein
MDSATVRQKLKRGAVSGGLRAVLAIPVYLVLTPLVARTLGPEQLGVWSFGSMLVNIFSFTDFGLAGSLTFHVARETKDEERVNAYFNAVFWLYLAIALSVFLVTLTTARPLAAGLLRVPPPLQAKAAYVLSIFAAGFGARFVAAAFQGVIEAHQDYAFTQLVFTKWLFLNFIGSCLALWLAPNLYALGVVSFSGNLFILVAFALRLRRHFPRVRPRLSSFDTAVLASMMRFGSWILVASIVGAFREPILKVLIARYYNLAAVADFEISARLCNQVVAVVGAPIGGTFAVSAYLSHNRSELADLIRIVFFLVLSVFVPITLFGHFFGSGLVTWWLGNKFAGAGHLFPAMLTAFSIYYATEPLYKALEGSGHARYSALVQAFSLAVSLTAFMVATGDLAGSVKSFYLVGFTSFSAVNILAFRHNFTQAAFLNTRRIAGLLVPASLLLVLKPLLPATLFPLIFALYLAVHLAAVHLADIVNLSCLFGQWRFLGIGRDPE